MMIFPPPHSHLSPVQDRLSPVAELKREKLIPEQDDDRKKRAELDHHKKYVDKRIGALKFYKFIQKDHMTGATHRQPFCDSLYNAEYHCF